MTDAPDIVDVYVGTPLGTSDHCFVSCGFRVEQSEPECNVRSNVFLKHRANRDNVCCAVGRFTWSIILKSADPIDAFDRAIGEVIGRLVLATVFGLVDLETCNGLMPAAGELIMQCRLLIVPHVQHTAQIIRVLACAKAQRIYGATRESHNKQTRNTLKNSTCSHKWWETLKGVKQTIFGVKQTIPVLWGPGGGLVGAPAETASFQGFQFDSKQCREQFVTPLSCFPQSRCNSLAFRTPVFRRLLLDLDTWWF